MIRIFSIKIFPRVKRRLDIYALAGIIVLAIASTILILLIAGNWESMILGSGRYQYLVAVIAASTIPPAMLLLYVLSIKGSRTKLRSIESNADSESGEEPGGGTSAGELYRGELAREVKIEAGVVSDRQGGKSEEQTQVPREEGASANAAKQIGIENIENVVREEVAKATAGLISKIDGFSQDVQGIRKELEEIRSSVEGTMIDIRSLLSEISNPFNYMRRFVTESDIKELGLSISSGQKEASKGISASSTEAGVAVGGAAINVGDSSDRHEKEVRIDSISFNRFSGELKEVFSGEASVSKLMRIIMFVGDNLQTLGRDGLLGIVELGVSSGIIPKESMDVVAKVVSLIESTKVPPKKLAVTLHRLARSLGISDKEAEFLAMALSEE